MGERSLTGVEMNKPTPALVTVHQNQKPRAHCSSLKAAQQVVKCPF